MLFIPSLLDLFYNASKKRKSMARWVIDENVQYRYNQGGLYEVSIIRLKENYTWRMAQ
jgi:hypothetical protein